MKVQEYRDMIRGLRHWLTSLRSCRWEERATEARLVRSSLAALKGAECKTMKKWDKDMAASVIADAEKELRKFALEVELRDAWEGEGNSVKFHEWVAAMADNDRGTLQVAAKEFLAFWK